MKITIPNPCHENWELMTPEEKGRFCSVCSKTVRDFTDASDREIAEVYSISEEAICGNFYESQLNRNLHYSYVNSLFTKFTVGFILTAGGFVSVHAQQNTPSDSLNAGEIKEVVIFPAFNKMTHQKMMVGASTVISEDDLRNAPKNEEAKNLTRSEGLVINPMTKDHTGTEKVTIGGAHSSIRGDSDPLIVVDGKIISSKEFRELDSSSIQKIDLLKDASAITIYGEKAKNGVILLYMKKKWRSKKTLGK